MFDLRDSLVRAMNNGPTRHAFHSRIVCIVPLLNRITKRKGLLFFSRLRANVSASPRVFRRLIFFFLFTKESDA